MVIYTEAEFRRVLAELPTGEWLGKIGEGDEGQRMVCHLRTYAFEMNGTQTCAVCRLDRHLWEDDDDDVPVTETDTKPDDGISDISDSGDDTASEASGFSDGEFFDDSLPTSFQPGRLVAASFGYVKGKPTRCAQHRLLGMENVIATPCEVENCKNQGASAR